MKIHPFQHRAQRQHARKTLQHALQLLLPTQLTPRQSALLSLLLNALAIHHTLAETRLCAFLALRTGRSPATWRSRLRRAWTFPITTLPYAQTLLNAAHHFLPHDQPLVFVLDATQLKNRWIALVVAVAVDGTALPIAWHLRPQTQTGSWNPIWCQMLRALRGGGVPKARRVMVVCARGISAPAVWRAIVANGWHPVMRVSGTVPFRVRYGRRRSTVGLVGALRVGEQGQWSGWAFKEAVRCVLVGVWEVGSAEPCWVLTDGALGVSEALGWYRRRAWIEGMFRRWKRGGYGWHPLRTLVVERMMWKVWVYGLALWLSWLLGRSGGVGCGRCWGRLSVVGVGALVLECVVVLAEWGVGSVFWGAGCWT